MPSIDFFLFLILLFPSLPPFKVAVSELNLSTVLPHWDFASLRILSHLLSSLSECPRSLSFLDLPISFFTAGTEFYLGRQEKNSQSVSSRDRLLAAWFTWICGGRLTVRRAGGIVALLNHTPKPPPPPGHRHLLISVHHRPKPHKTCHSCLPRVVGPGSLMCSFLSILLS